MLEENINELITLCGQLLEGSNSFLVLNLYSMGLSALLARSIVRQLVGDCTGNNSESCILPIHTGSRCR